MSIIKHEYPILEYDTDPHAVIEPNHEHFTVTLPRKAVIGFLADEIDRYATVHNAKAVATLESITKRFPIYVVEYQGVEICLCQGPMGAPAATQLLDWLIGYGVREVIAAGSCGALCDFAENEFFIPTKALRDEGTSYHYLPPARYVNLSVAACTAIEQTMTAHRLPCRTVTTWTTDGFYRETREKVSYRKGEGCAVVEMECAAMAACASLRGATFGELLYTADTLANVDSYDERDWGRASHSLALKLALDAVCNIQTQN